MGIVSSAFASLAVQIAWNCQRLLDPRYRCVEDKPEAERPAATRIPEADPLPSRRTNADCLRRASAESHSRRTSAEDACRRTNSESYLRRIGSEDAFRKSNVPDASRRTNMADGSKRRSVADVSKRSKMADASKRANVANVSKRTNMADVSKRTNMADGKSSLKMISRRTNSENYLRSMMEDERRSRLASSRATDSEDESRGASIAGDLWRLNMADAAVNPGTHARSLNRRVRQLRYRKRPSSVDGERGTWCGQLTTSGRWTRGNGALGTGSEAVGSDAATFDSAQGQPALFSDPTSSSGCSSESASCLDSESDGGAWGRSRSSSGEPEVAGQREERGMSAAEEEAFRLTVGRGHFSRSKKDKFLNHLRLEKRLNDMNKEFFEVACLSNCRTLQRRSSGDLHRIV